jgi:hypothetical protein
MPISCASTSNGWIRRILAALPREARAWLWLALAAAPAAAQQSGTVAGQVLRLAGHDSLPVPAAALVLHRITHTVQGPIDSLRADGRGRFRFRLPPDTSAIFLVSARFGGIEYFSPPLRFDLARPDSALTIVVSDTSRTAPVHVGSRHAVISQLGPDGTRGVLEIVGLVNPGDHTRVSADSNSAVWGIRLPAGTGTVRPGQGDFSPEALVVRHDSILLMAPIAPGEKQVVYSYSLPASVGRLPLQFDDPVSEVNVLVEDQDARVSGGTLARADTQVIEGRSFRRWSGAMPAAGTLMVIFPGAANSAWLLPALVSLTAVGLALAAWRLMRRPAVARGVTEIDLVGAIAALDARYLGRQSEVASDEWQRYQAERSALKERAELARRGTGS